MSFLDHLNEDNISEAMSVEKKELKTVMALVSKAEKKAIKALNELRESYRMADSNYEEAFGWQSAPDGNQGYAIDELLNTINDKNSYYNRKFGEMK